MSNTQKSIQDHTYKTSLTLLGPPQNIINSYGFANYITKRVQQPQEGLLLDGVRISEQFYLNNKYILYIFGYPIDVRDPNGCMLYKIAQHPEFKMDIQFARIFVILYLKQVGLASIGGDVMNLYDSLSEMDCKLALYQHRIFHKILPHLVVKEQMANGVIKFIYQSNENKQSIQYVGSSSDIVVQVAQDFYQECESWYEQLKQEASQYPYTKNQTGYTVPEYKIYQNYLQKKESAINAQNEYTKNCIKAGQQPNYYFISALQIVNISDSELENVEISQKIQLITETEKQTQTQQEEQRQEVQQQEVQQQEQQEVQQQKEEQKK